MTIISAATARLCLDLLGQVALNGADPDLVDKARQVATARAELETVIDSDQPDR